MTPLSVFIGCESSGVVREEFRKRGHDAWSCDLLPADDGSPHHLQGDVFEQAATRPWWDIIILHPTCTFLTNAGARWLYQGGKRWNEDGTERPRDPKRWADLAEGAKFFRDCRELGKTARIGSCLENPIMHEYAVDLCGAWPFSMSYQPYEFGDEAFKRTCLWLDRLPCLKRTNVLTPPKPGTPEHRKWSAVHMASPGPDRWKVRSKSYPGPARAMAEQWGALTAPHTGTDWVDRFPV